MELTKTQHVGEVRLGSSPDWEDIEQAKNHLMNKGATSIRAYINTQQGGWGDTKVISLNGYKQVAI